MMPRVRQGDDVPVLLMVSQRPWGSALPRLFGLTGLRPKEVDVITTRPPETIGEFRFSVQNNRGTYSARRERNRLSPGPFRGFEVALWRRGGAFLRPSQVGIEGFDDHFDGSDTPIGTFVPLAVVRRLRQALIALAQASPTT